jgi:hypothetical protein
MNLACSGVYSEVITEEEMKGAVVLAEGLDYKRFEWLSRISLFEIFFYFLKYKIQI